MKKNVLCEKGDEITRFDRSQNSSHIVRIIPTQSLSLQLKRPTQLSSPECSSRQSSLVINIVGTDDYKPASALS